MTDDDGVLQVQVALESREAVRLIAARISALRAAIGEAERRKVDGDGSVAVLGEPARNLRPEAAPGRGAVDQNHRLALLGTAKLREDRSVRRRDQPALGGRQRLRTALPDDRGDHRSARPDHEQHHNERRKPYGPAQNSP